MPEVTGLRRLRAQVVCVIYLDSAAPSADAGPDVLVAGSSVFRGPGSIAENLAALRRAAATEV
jgi:pentose-5-phosphate-3-epimerase